MIAETFAYTIVVASLIGLAAASVERSLGELARPRRIAWIGAYAVAVSFPLLSLLAAASAPAPPAAATSRFLGAALSPPPADWSTALLSAWAATTILLLTLYAAAWLRLYLLARRWPRIAGGAARLLATDDVGPAVLGILRPRIVLPRWLVDGPARTRRVVVAHELEHIAARDQAVLAAAHLVAILLPWNLPLWWFARRLRTAIEIDCDARVLRSGVDPGRYADILLAVGQRRSSSPYVAATLIEPVTQLERRIRIMLTNRRPPSAWRAATTIVLAAALAACATAVEPPVLVPATARSSEPATAPEVVVASLPGASRFIQGPDGQFTIEAQVFVHVPADNRLQITTERMSQSDSGFLLDGNVRIESGGTSITASRAVIDKTPSGETILTVYGAKLITVRPDASGAPSGE